MFDNTLTIVINHYCIFTEALPRLKFTAAFGCFRLCRGCGFRPTVVNSRQSCLAKTRFYRVQMFQ